MDMRLRLLSALDIPSIDPLLMAAYGNPRSFAPRLERLLSIEPEGWIVAEETESSEDGSAARIVGMGGIVVMGGTGYIGLVASDPAMQRRGIATLVMRRLFEIAADRRCERMLLDASLSGRPLYEKLGFLAEDTVGQWVRKAGAYEGGGSSGFEGSVSTLAEAGFGRGFSPAQLPTELADLDLACWGDHRARALASYAADDPALVFLARGPDGRLKSYAILQSGTGILGPFVALEASAAAALLSVALVHGSLIDLTAYLPGANVEGRILLERAGFALARELTHMRLGEALDSSRRRLVYSQASYALG